MKIELYFAGHKTLHLQAQYILTNKTINSTVSLLQSTTGLITVSVTNYNTGHNQPVEFHP